MRAFEKAGAANKRFFIVSGYCSNDQIIEIIRENFPKYRENLPDKSVSGGGKKGCSVRALLNRSDGTPELPDTYKVDVRRSIEVLGLNYKSLEECIVDTVRSFASIPA